MENIYEAEVVKSKSAGSKKNIRTVICFAILSLMTMLGIAGGFAYFSLVDTVYESKGTFRLEFQNIDPPIEGLDLSNVSDVRHDLVFAQANIVAQCLNRNKLTNLRSFQNTPEDMIVAQVLDNLEVKQNAEEPKLYEVVYRANRPDDSQTVLNNLINDYEKHLTIQEQVITTTYLTSLKTWYERYQQEIKRLESEGSEALVAEVTKRLDDVHEKLLRMDMLNDLNGRQGTVRLSALMNATYGEPVWPILPLNLLVGAAIGFGVGFAMILFWFVIRALS